MPRYFVCKLGKRRDLESTLQAKVLLAAEHAQVHAALTVVGGRNKADAVLFLSVSGSGQFQGAAKVISCDVNGSTLEVLTSNYLPFAEVSHLKNPLDKNNPVSMSKDGQELAAAVGKKLLALITADKSKATTQGVSRTLDMGAGAPKAKRGRPADSRGANAAAAVPPTAASRSLHTATVGVTVVANPKNLIHAGVVHPDQELVEMHKEAGYAQLFTDDVQLCSICFAEHTQQVGFLPCKHFACVACVNKLRAMTVYKAATHPRCPFCRKDILEFFLVVV
eukprot:TRINITY_DN5249_c0_g1_i1.p1 TRINITY_DN5249_c0_g1~~TRINITY_DN5249_c0_g1_i1.p1  ORF type:complete len:279 (-),score=62.11 TRINITY_DN5249_c0_g1_i1:32-868(-)